MHLNIKKTKEESPKMTEGFLLHEAISHLGNKLKLEENRGRTPASRFLFLGIGYSGNSDILPCFNVCVLHHALPSILHVLSIFPVCQAFYNI